ncbi:hypothetical protein E2562_015139 [Oryza meyeriana var. granulata]|uniref:Anthocyanin 5-aromatic acyltransferase n=1 Tax=Oryza meyeriana var. granulata TaxID=110450 RepID=A0A6G1DXZ5_9ORYZ|nr:hypothetical protein E2562_015139 [Oryza meyeriana var. granulata]
MASSAEVRIVATTRVPLLHQPPPHLEHLPLRRLPSLVESLKSSLADAIAVFFPLAGKLTYLPFTGDVVIDCSLSAVGDGVVFLEAEAYGDARVLSGAERHDVPAFLRFVPSLEAPEPPAPVFAVQATRFVDGGGVAVGVAAHHAVADLPTANLLRRTWQHHDTTTLELESHRVAHIKNRIGEVNQAATTASPGTNRRPLPSTLVAISALIWSSVIRARSSQPNDSPGDDACAHLVFLADCRPWLDRPVDAAYFGNCVRGCVAEAAAWDLADPRSGVLRARDAIEKAVDGFLERPMEAFDKWLDSVGALLRQPGFVAVTASPRFPAYAAADLGWGAPSRVEFVSESAPEGMMVVTGGRKKASVQVSACLSPEHMDAFRSLVLDW